MKKKIPLWGALAACVLCVLAGGLLVIGVLRLTLGAEGIALLQTQALIQTRFVGDYDPEEVHQAAETAMVNALGDRWSYYLTPQQLQQTADTRNNSYVGVGITVEDVEEGLLITVVNPDGPAQKAGVLPGEIITAVDGAPVTPGNRDESIDAIRGESGTSVVLELLDEAGARREVTVTRGAVRVISARWEMLEDDVALLTIANFYTGAADQAARCLEELQEAGARALVIDVWTSSFPRGRSSGSRPLPGVRRCTPPDPPAWTCPWRCWSTRTATAPRSFSPPRFMRPPGPPWWGPGPRERAIPRTSTASGTAGR